MISIGLYILIAQQRILDEESTKSSAASGSEENAILTVVKRIAEGGIVVSSVHSAKVSRSANE